MEIEIVVRNIDPMYDTDGPHIRANVVFQAPMSSDDGAPINAAEVVVFFCRRAGYPARGPRSPGDRGGAGVSGPGVRGDVAAHEVETFVVNIGGKLDTATDAGILSDSLMIVHH